MKSGTPRRRCKKWCNSAATRTFSAAACTNLSLASSEGHQGLVGLGQLGRRHVLPVGRVVARRASRATHTTVIHHPRRHRCAVRFRCHARSHLGPRASSQPGRSRVWSAHDGSSLTRKTASRSPATVFGGVTIRRHSVQLFLRQRRPPPGVERSPQPRPRPAPPSRSIGRRKRCIKAHGGPG